MEKRAIVIFMNDKYVLPFKVFIHSLYATNPEYKDYDLVVLHTELSIDNMWTIEGAGCNVKFIPVLTENYDIKHPENVVYAYLIPTFYKLDVFRLRGYDKVVMIDVDMLVYTKFTPDLFDFKGDILMCDDGIKGMFNSGLVVIGKKYLNDDVYREVLKMIEQNPRLPDQVIINDYFVRDIKRLPHRYNVTGPILSIIRREKVAIYHFAGVNKPWNIDGGNNFFNDWRAYAKSINAI